MIIQFQEKYRPLSNFWYLQTHIYLPVHILGYDDDTGYKTVEHAYQAAKSFDSNDRLAIHRIIKPGDTKRYGKTVQLRSDWEQIKVALMINLVRQKFDNSRELMQLLVSTDDQMIIEGNRWHDNEWGICYCDTCAYKRNRDDPDLGKNILGKILMNLRGHYKTLFERL